MCGIAAIFTSSPSSDVTHWISGAIKLVNHRGPDGTGTVFSCNDSVSAHPDSPVDWGLGHTRLAILGLGDQGHQPMQSSDGTCWVVFNGEIYNYIELRAELNKLGHEVIGNSDTAVLLAAWSAWGTSCVERFNGMFAFVLVDTKRGVGFAARDRLGIKPLYCWKGTMGTVFVSEIKQLTAIPQFRARANLQQVQDFLVDDVAGHEQSKTFFDNVFSVPPAHRLLWKLGNQPDINKTEQWWQLRDSSEKMSWEEVVDGVKTHLLNAISLRMRSDVAVGSCLSGGVDSSSIVSVVTKILGESIATFSSCSYDPKFDEQEYIDIVNKDTACTPNKVFPSESGAIENFDKIVWHQDEPFGSLSLYSQWCVMQLAKENNVSVLLDGQGGDEIFCGYRKYVYFYLKYLINSKKYFSAFGHAKSMFFNGDGHLFDLRAGIRYLPKILRKRIEPPIKIQGTLLEHNRHPWEEQMSGVRSIGEHRMADLLQWSLPILLRYEDRSSMAHGVEARVPFVDHNLIEFALAIPPEHLFCKGRGKTSLIDAMSGILTDPVRQRKTKMGFESPQSDWMKGAFGNFAEGRIRQCDALQDWIDVNRLLDNSRVNKRNWGVVQQARFRAASVASWVDCFGISNHG